MVRKKQSRKRTPCPKNSNIISEDICLPNHSGMLDAGKVHRTPTDDLDPVNKKYVDDEIVDNAWLQATNQTGLTGDKTGSFDLTTTGLGEFDRIVGATEYGSSTNYWSVADATGTIGDLLKMPEISFVSTGALTSSISGSLRNLMFIRGVEVNPRLQFSNETGLHLVGFMMDRTTGVFTFGPEIGTTSTVWNEDFTFNDEVHMLDNKNLFFGTGNDATIDYDGTNMWINSDAVGSGSLKIGDASNHVEITPTGDTIFVGTGGLPYGSMYQTSGSTFTVTLTNQNTNYELDAATTNINAGELNLCTFPDDHYILVQKAGRYLINYSVEASINSVAGGSQHIETCIMINGTAVASKGTTHNTYAATAGEHEFSSTAILDLAANDQISLCMNNNTSAGKIMTIDHINVTVVQVGGT